MEFLSLPLVNWTNGIVMIGIFALVVVILVAVLFSLMNSDKKSDSSSDSQEST